MPRPPLRLPQVPQVADAGLQQWVNAMHEVVSGLVYPAQVPNAPSGLVVTPIAGGNVIQFTRSNALSYALYMGHSPDRAAAVQIDLRSSNQFTDNVGSAGVKRYYWVVGLNQNGALSSVLGPGSGVTLPLGAPASIPVLPVQAQRQVFDVTINRNRPALPTTDPTVAGLPEPK